MDEALLVVLEPEGHNIVLYALLLKKLKGPESLDNSRHLLLFAVAHIDSQLFTSLPEQRRVQVEVYALQMPGVSDTSNVVLVAHGIA